MEPLMIAIPFALLITGCATTALPQREDAYMRHVGDIPFDPATDDAGFHLCAPTAVQHWYATSLGYTGGTKALEASFNAAGFRTANIADYSGYINLRFIVNCHGLTDRYRIIAMQEDFSPISCPPALEKELLATLANCKGWIPARYEGTPYDSYMCLTLIFKRGALQTILPTL